MHTADERITRCLQVMQDAFEGQPVYLEREGDTWVGQVLSVREKFTPIFNVTLSARDDSVTVGVVVTYPDGQTTHTSIGTYDHLARWAYDLARTRDLQEWVTPRHFAHLVSRILVPCPYNGSWPHEHKVTIGDDVTLSFHWDEEECRLVATLSRSGRDEETYGVTSPGDAVGWLTLVKERVQVLPPTT